MHSIKQRTRESLSLTRTIAIPHGIGKIAPVFAPGRRCRSVAIGIVAALLIAASVVVVASGELRSALMFAVTPRRARDAHLVAFVDREGRSLYVLGTVHGAHLDTASFSLLHVQAVIDHLRPDLVLVESRPEEIAIGNWGDGPIEMPFASLHARSRGISTDGFDFWLPDAHAIRRSDDVREDRMMENVVSRLAGHRVVLVLTGYSHVAELSSRLAAKGWSTSALTDETKRTLFDTTGMTLRFPHGMRDAITGRIARDSAELRSRARDPDRDEGIRLRRRLLDSIRDVGEAPAP